MSLKKDLTTNFAQTTESCLIVSYAIIANYFTDWTLDEMILKFFDEVQPDANRYNINIDDYKDNDLQENYYELYKHLFYASNRIIEFSHTYLENKLRPSMIQHGVNTQIVNVGGNMTELGNTLLDKEAALSISGEVKVPNGNQWHAVPTYHKGRFKGVNYGKIVELGNELENIRQKAKMETIGDGIFFNRIQ